ncbi:MAG: hypothetical protein ABJN26_06230 [Stappiaceae bacterium]
MPKRPDKIEQAANWWAVNKGANERSFVPILREKFDLTILEAIEAAKRASDNQYGDAREQTP